MSTSRNVVVATQLESGLSRAKTYILGWIGDLVGTVASNISQLNTLKVDKPTSSSFTLPTTGWTKDNNETSPYAYYYDLAVSGITTNDIINAQISRETSTAAINAGLCFECESLAGKIRFRSSTIPTNSISGTYFIIEGASAQS